MEIPVAVKASVFRTTETVVPSVCVRVVILQVSSNGQS